MEQKSKAETLLGKLQSSILKDKEKKITEVAELKEREENELFKGHLGNLNDWLQYQKFVSERKDDNQKRKDLAKDSELKSEHAIKAFKFTRVWFVVIIAIILFKGYTKFTSFELSESEFLMTIGTLTTSIFAFYVIVLKYLFNTGPKE